MKDGYSIYDTHTHMGAARHSGRSSTAAELLHVMDEHGVDRAVTIPYPVVEDYRGQHDLIGRAVREYPDRFTGAACLDPYVAEREFRDEVRRCREIYGFRALKLQPQYHGLNPISDRSSFFFETAIENSMAVIVHTGSGIPFSLPALCMMPARKYPELTIVLAHCGGGIFVHEAILAASFCPNIVLELSSLMPHQIFEVLDAVPADRLMIGSDLLENTGVEMGKILTLNISAEQKQTILCGTACRVFGGC